MGYQEVLEAARKRMDRLTKPPRSLGYLEEVGVRL
ncbi:MAG: nicotinate-nucleotide--dimethylbenzimidazole phosphoribosyltransferase, partial [Thermus sp.]